MPLETVATPSPLKPRKQEWTPRLWEGMDCFTWMRLLRDNNFAVQPPYWYLVGTISVSSVINTVLGWARNGWHGDRIRDAVVEPPVFVPRSLAKRDNASTRTDDSRHAVRLPGTCRIASTRIIRC